MLTLTAADSANLSLLHSPALARLLRHARVVPSEAVPQHVVTMYSRVLCIDLQNGKREIWRLVYPADPAGDVGGALRRVRVAEVLYQPEHDLGTRLIFNSGRASSTRKTPP